MLDLLLGFVGAMYILITISQPRIGEMDIPEKGAFTYIFVDLMGRIEPNFSDVEDGITLEGVGGVTADVVTSLTGKDKFVLILTATLDAESFTSESLDEGDVNRFRVNYRFDSSAEAYLRNCTLISYRHVDEKNTESELVPGKGQSFTPSLFRTILEHRITDAEIQWRQGL